MRHRAIFITATDTGVGKTIVTALLLAHLRSKGIRAVAMKPISTGDRGDARLLRDLMDGEVTLAEINPLHFRHPLAPLVAGRLEGRTVSVERVLSTYRTLSSRHPFLLVEGVGGLLVPLRRRYAVADLVCDLGLPVLIVARPGLGTINHTALTVEAARARRIPVLGVVLNNADGSPAGLAERTNPEAIAEVCGVPVLARLPHLPGLGPSSDGIRAALRLPAVYRACAKISGC